MSSSTDKAKLFAWIFASNSTLDNKGHPLPTSHVSLCTTSVIFSLQLKKSQDIKSLDAKKATRPDKLLHKPVKSFKSIPRFKKRRQALSPSHYRHFGLLCIISKFFDAIISKFLEYLDKNSILSKKLYGFRSARPAMISQLFSSLYPQLSFIFHSFIHPLFLTF